MKRMLYWIGLLTIAILALMPDVLALPFSSASKALAQGSADQNPSAQQYSECSDSGISGEDFDAVRGIPEGTKVYDCENINDMSQDTHNDTGNCVIIEGPNGAVSRVCDTHNDTGNCVDIGAVSHVCIAPIRIYDPDPPKESPDSPNSRNSKKDRGSQHPGRRCHHLLTDANDTEVSVCGNKFLLEFPDGSKSLTSSEQLFQQAGNQQQAGDQQQAGNQQQAGDQQQAGNQQQAGDQQQVGDQRSDDQQQDGGQQGDSAQGYGCAARV